MSPWSQLGVFSALLIAAYWLAVFEHGDDGVDVPRARLRERRAHASRIDPLVPTPDGVEP